MRFATTIIFTLILSLTVLPNPAVGDEIFIDSRLGDIKIIEGEIPPPFEGEYWRSAQTPMVRVATYPYAQLDQPGEIYLTRPDNQGFFDPFADLSNLRLHLRAPSPDSLVTGTIYLPEADFSAMRMLRFELPASDATDSAKITFYQAQFLHYHRLLTRDLPGAAWYRHQRNETRQILEELEAEIPSGESQPGRRSDEDLLTDTYALFSGGRAVSENLALDQALPTPDQIGAAIPVDSIEGITVNEFAWDDLIENRAPEIDPLATFIPHDQHAIFFPSFQAMLDLIDSSSAHATPILNSIEPHAENVMVRQRYEKQLCLPLDTLGRTFGSSLINSIVITGSDPYLPTGSDVAILFEAKNATALKTAIALQYTAAQTNHGGVIKQGVLDGINYTGIRNDDRSVSSYMLSVDNTVIVTNSLAQLQNIINAQQNKTPSLDELDEYTFFRDRYQRNNPDETALIILSDPTIRRWCGPRWRIGTSRRTRATATMMDLQATYMPNFVQGEMTPGRIYTASQNAHLGELTITPAGIISSTYGSLEFQTPITELDLDLVSSIEADHYENWRTGYQNAWRNTFDPIAIQFAVADQLLAVDLTVMPIIVGSEYRQFVELSRGATIKPDAGDPHPGTLLHLAFAINKKSSTGQMASGMAMMFAPEIGLDPLGWLGESVSVYFENDPIWTQIAEENDEASFEDALSELPFALHCEVESGLKLTAFLAAARAYIDQSAPDMLVWENRKYAGRSYVAVSLAEAEKTGESIDDLTIYYLAGRGALIITFSENLIEKAIDRREINNLETNTATAQSPNMPWLGKNLCIQTDEGILAFLEAFPENTYQYRMQAVAWSNIPILNEWKRLYPDQDPLKVHADIWKSNLVCPGGGTYLWNEQFQTMESTIYGHPAQQKVSADAPPLYEQIKKVNSGVTFENQGLRARLEFHQEE